MAAYPASTLPTAMDVVWCRFPYHDKPGKPGVVPHPGLVLGVNEYRENEYAVLIVYGTSTLKPDQRPNDLIIMNAVNLCYAGLAQATRFDLDRFKWLPWADDWFAIQDPQRHKSPVIGRLPQEEIEDLRRIMSMREAAGLPVPKWSN